ncbi:MAG TPA: 2-hydroxyhepta-2,4-diene-1,7-dioate isomerase, partial [Pseudomonadaceae bacterium]|nr:2-hydroxyhepta-2,4-diene-1,7-dioate isomerase [Pseudomonadaceae bacterium]
DGLDVYSGSVALDSIQRRFEDLVACLFSECSFPAGVLLMTGAGIIPEAPFTLRSGDRISITIDHIGTLVNTVA